MMPARFLQAAAPFVFDVLLSRVGTAALGLTATFGVASFLYAGAASSIPVSISAVCALPGLVFAVTAYTALLQVGPSARKGTEAVGCVFDRLLIEPVPRSYAAPAL